MEERRNACSWSNGGPLARLIASALAACLLLIMSGVTAEASLMVTSFGSRFEVDFESTVDGVNNGSFAGLGIAASPTPGKLDADAWTVAGFSSPSDVARGKSRGGVTTGGLYSFVTTPTGLPENIILGIQPTGSDFTPGSITLSAQNLTGATITKWAIDYQVFFFNNGGRSSALNFAFGVDGTFKDVGALDFATPTGRESSSLWRSVDRSTVIDARVDHGEYLSLRWTSNDLSGSGSRDEFGIDRIGVTAQRQNAAVPEPRSVTLLLMILGCVVAFVQTRRNRKPIPT